MIKMIRYLKACGFKVDSEGYLIEKVKDNSFYPKLSCTIDEDEGYIFVLHYNPDVDYCRTDVRFTFDELPKLDILEFFSLSPSFLRKVRNSRVGGQKHWKIRNHPLPFKPLKVAKALGCKLRKKESCEVVERRKARDTSMAQRNMQVCIMQAAKTYSFQPFDMFYEAWKECGGVGGRKAAFQQFKEAVEKIQNKVG